MAIEQAESDARCQTVIDYGCVLEPEVRVVVANQLWNPLCPWNDLLDQVKPHTIDEDSPALLSAGAWGLAVGARESYIAALSGSDSENWLLAHVYKTRGLYKKYVGLVEQLTGDLSIVLFGGSIYGNSPAMYDRQTVLFKNLAHRAGKTLRNLRFYYNPVPCSDMSAFLTVKEGGSVHGTLFVTLWEDSDG